MWPPADAMRYGKLDSGVERKLPMPHWAFCALLWRQKSPFASVRSAEDCQESGLKSWMWRCNVAGANRV